MDGLLDGLTIGFAWVVRSSWQGALVVVFILAVQGALRGKLSAGWRHALWGLLIARLLLVWAPPAPWSVYNVAIPGAAVTWEAGAEREALGRDLKDEVEEGIGVEVAPLAAASAMKPTVGETKAPEMRTAVADEAGGEPIVATEVSGGGWPWRAIASLTWLGVAVLLGGAMLWQTLRFARQVRGGRLVTNSDALDLLEACRARLGVGTYLALVETDGVRSPALLGCIRPKLLVPRGFLDSLSQEEMRHVFLHELAHVKRGDIWSSWAINLLTVVHWFNPLIWLARRRFIADREAACDAHVLAALDEPEQRAYGHTVLNLMQRFNTAGWAPGIAGISESNSNLKRRIVMIKHFRTPSRLAAWVGAGLCVGLGLVTLTNAQERMNLDAIRQQADALAKDGRYAEAIELLEKGRTQSEAVGEEFSGLIVRYKLSGDIALTAEERGYVLRELDVKGETETEEADSVTHDAQVVDDDALWPIALSKSGLLGKIGATEEAILRAQEQQLSVRQREALEDYVRELEELRTARAPILLRPAADESHPDYGREYTLKNSDDDWVYFQSMETDEGPELLLEQAGGVERLPAARDKVLISYLADGSYSMHQQLSVNLNDKNRVLMVFNLPAEAEREPVTRAWLELELRQSGKPTAAPFAMAVHRITEPWENDTTWYTQPPFDAEPSTVVMVPPEPGTVKVDVTDLVNTWLSGVAPNYGLLLRVEEPFYGPLILAATSSKGMFSDTEIRDMPIDELFQYMVHARVGYHKISARLALAERASLDSESHGAIVAEATRRLRDAAWGYERFCCAMLLGTIGEGKSVNPLASAMKSDPAPGVREGVAIALGLFDTPEARAALEAAAGTEAHPRVSLAIRRALGGEYQVERPWAAASAVMPNATSTVRPQPERPRLGAFAPYFSRAASVQESAVNVPPGPTPGAAPAEAELRTECQNNLKQLGLALKIYANESAGSRWPVLAREAGRLAVAWGDSVNEIDGMPVLSVAYLTDMSITVCPSTGAKPLAPDDTDYVYLAYAMKSDHDVQRYAEKYRAWGREGAPSGHWFQEDDRLSQKEAAGVREFPLPLREGVERFFSTDINDPAASRMMQSRIPVVIEWPDRHPASAGGLGGNVLYMDGHVEFMPFPGAWPMTEATIGTLAELAGREPVFVAR